MTDRDPGPDRDTENVILDHLRMVADLSARAGHGRAHWVYRSAYQLLLEHGRVFTPAPRRPGIAMMPDRLCYANAAASARPPRPRAGICRRGRNPRRRPCLATAARVVRHPGRHRCRPHLAV